MPLSRSLSLSTWQIAFRRLVIPIQHMHHPQFLHGDRRQLPDRDVDNRAVEPCRNIPKHCPGRFGGHR
jgi:hypothetical protein